MCPRKFCCFHTLFIRSVQLSVTYIIHDRSREKIRILKYNSKRTAEVRLSDFIDVNAVITNFPVRNIIKAVNQICDCGFSCPGRAYKSHLLPRLRIQGNIMQYCFFRLISKIHVKHFHFTGKLRICHASVGTVRMFPRPHPGTLLTLCQLPIFFTGVDQRDIALVRLMCLVDQCKNTLRPCQSHNYRIQLVRHLADVSCKLFGHIQERYDNANTKSQS